MLAASVGGARGWSANLDGPTLCASSALAAVTVALTCLLARRWFGEWAGLWAGVIVATTPQFIVHATSPADLAFAASVLAAMLAASGGVSGFPPLHLVAGAAIGLAIALKGPLGLAAGAPYAVYAILRPSPAPGRPQFASWWSQVWAWLGLLLAVGVVVAWHGIPSGGLLPATARTAAPEVRGRALARVILLTYWPWLPLLAIGAREYLHRVRRHGSRWEGIQVGLFCVGYLGILWALAASDPLDLLPVYAFLAMVAALPLTRWVPQRGERWVVCGLLAAAGVIALVAVVLHRAG